MHRQEIVVKEEIALDKQTCLLPKPSHFCQAPVRQAFKIINKMFFFLGITYQQMIMIPTPPTSNRMPIKN